VPGSGGGKVSLKLRMSKVLRADIYPTVRKRREEKSFRKEKRSKAQKKPHNNLSEKDLSEQPMSAWGYRLGFTSP